MAAMRASLLLAAVPAVVPVSEELALAVCLGGRALRVLRTAPGGRAAAELARPSLAVRPGACSGPAEHRVDRQGGRVRGGARSLEAAGAPWCLTDAARTRCVLSTDP